MAIGAFIHQALSYPKSFPQPKNHYSHSAQSLLADAAELTREVCGENKKEGSNIKFGFNFSASAE